MKKNKPQIYKASAFAPQIAPDPELLETIYNEIALNLVAIDETKQYPLSSFSWSELCAFLPFMATKPSLRKARSDDKTYSRILDLATACVSMLVLLRETQDNEKP